MAVAASSGALGPLCAGTSGAAPPAAREGGARRRARGGPARRGGHAVWWVSLQGLGCLGYLVPGPPLTAPGATHRPSPTGSRARAGSPRGARSRLGAHSPGRLERPP
ncbi:unnamed protein product [Prorocentrum cordatum]|uniref:Uncharacterized protein n=1 Tax=Prorocentrum cordatum TaxID=2364126 RepID=A0ABN9REW8_9DINO|nr:unnamed protein product [Polarella glacialis]